MITISLCMIVKNEEAVLDRCLSSIADLMDEIIVVDTGSTDDTKEIAAKYTDKIYDFPWNDDFSAARNFSFSKATMDYIYTADADEVLDVANHRRFGFLKYSMLPEIEIVQMKYITQDEYNTVMNIQNEYRPKLYKRLREFHWIDPIHETVQTEPLVYDSEVEILHLPQSLHSKRDFRVFLHAYAAGHALSAKLHRMYAKELFISGTAEDFSDARAVFEQSLLQNEADSELVQEALCVLCRCARTQQEIPAFFKYAVRAVAYAPCSEICCELGDYFYGQKDYEEAIRWYHCAAMETASCLDVHASGDHPLRRLSECFAALAEAEGMDAEMMLEQAAEYQQMADAWQLPAE